MTYGVNRMLVSVFFDSLEKWYYQSHWIRNFRFWKVLNHTRYEIMHGNSISPFSLQLTLPIPFPLPLSLSHHPSPLWGFPWLSIWREFENQPTASNSSNYFLTSNTRHWNCERIMVLTNFHVFFSSVSLPWEVLPTVTTTVIVSLVRTVYNVARVLALYKSYRTAMNKIFIYARACVNKMTWAFCCKFSPIAPCTAA